MPLEIPGVRLRALLCLLTLTPGRTVPADELIEALWSERPPPGAGSTIRSHVARLRRLLGQQTVVAATGGYRLAVEDVELDMLALTRVRAAVREGQGLGAADLRPVLERWRGTPYPELIDWMPAVIASRSLSEDYLTVHEHYVDLEIAAGRAHDVVADLERVVGQFPFRESLWVQLARARYLAGNQVAALRACHEARTLLAEEAGVEPAGELVAIERAIRDQTVAPAFAARWSHAQTSRLVGRQTELARLRAAASGSAGMTVLVSGEAGIGKSALLEAFVAERRAAGAQVGFGRATASPLRVFAALRDVVGQLGHEATVVEQIGDGHRVAQVEAFRRALQPTSERPVAAVIDDAQWLDDDEVSVLTHVMMRPGLGICWVLAVRPEELATQPLLTETFDRLAGEQRLIRIDLEGLDRDDVRELVERAGIPRDEIPAVTDVIVERAGGHPLFTVELLRSSGHGDAHGDFVERPVPDAVRDLVMHRLNRLGPAATTIASSAAVAGESFTIGSVARASSLTMREVIDVLDRGAMARLFRPGASPAEAAFSHALVREAVLASLSFARRTALHASMAEVLDGQPGSSARDVARHTQDAGDLVEGAVASLRYERAAEACLAAGGVEEALHWATQAQQLAPTLSTSCVRIRALLRLGRGDEALGALTALLTHDDATVGTTLIAITGDLAEHTMPMTTSPGSPLQQVTDRAFALVGPTHPAWPRVALGWARARQFHTSNTVVFDVVDRAVRVAQARGDSSLTASALIARMERGASPRRADQTLRVANELIAIGEASDRPDWTAWGRAFRISAQLHLGRIDDGLREMRELDENAKHSREPVTAAAHAMVSA